MWTPNSLFLLSCLSLLAIVSLSQADPDHFILTRVTTLALARLDPIVNPGNISAHLHNIMGGSCFNQNLNSPEQQQDCDCSSAIVGADKSNYWAPAAFYQYPNGSFSAMLGGARIYYFTKSMDVKPFPPGLRMISGIATSRNTTDTRSFGVKLSCNDGVQSQYLPNGTSFPDGCDAVSLGIYFPSCGLANGQLDSDDHFSHMAWPQTQPGGGMPRFDNVNGDLCPDSHPIKYPTIFLQTNYYPTADQPWHSGNPVLLSTGDRSGLTFHADFHNGWDQQVLADTIEQCGFGNGPGDQLEQCAPLAKYVNETETWYCRYQNQIPMEHVGLYRPIDQLPGCNKVWPTDGPDEKPECVEEAPPALVHPDVEFVNPQYHQSIPMVFTATNNISNVKDEHVPSLGASYLLPWGSDGSDSSSLQSSNVSQLASAAEGKEDECEPPSVAAREIHGPNNSRQIRKHRARYHRRHSPEY